MRNREVMKKIVKRVGVLALAMICLFQTKTEVFAAGSKPTTVDVDEIPAEFIEEDISYLKPYIEENPGYEVHTKYLSYENAINGDFYHIYYPELVSTGEASQESLDKINELVLEVFSNRMNNMYPEFLYDYASDDYKLSDVAFVVTYMSKDLFSFVYFDHFCLGSEFLEFEQTKGGIFDINTGERYHLKDGIINHDVDFDKMLYDLMMKTDEQMTDTSIFNENVVQRMLDGEYVNNCYLGSLFLMDGSVMIGLNVHYISNTWLIKHNYTVTFEKEDMEVMANQCPMWSYYLSTGAVKEYGIVQNPSVSSGKHGMSGFKKVFAPKGTKKLNK